MQGLVAGLWLAFVAMIPVRLMRVMCLKRRQFAAAFQLEDAAYASRASPQTLDHGGWGGALGFADPSAGVGFGYVTNRMLGFDDVDPRRKVLIDAVYDAL